ncbi:MAG: TonB-dependent receptor, partial [Nitrospina sp.]|nr:TonB-dependent receptor [Nitrospina sp.]
IWMEPTRLGTLTGNVRLNKYLNLNAQLLYRGGWHREQGDPRENMSDYVTANATLIARNLLAELKGLEFRGAVYNLFNKDYTAPTAAGELPGDMPLPGINFMLELRYAF